MKFGMRVRRGLLAALVMFAVPAAATVAALLVASPAVAADTVASIQVAGNRRVDAATVRSYFHPDPNGVLSAGEIDDGLKA
ncbi:MAG: hypothetical protein ACREDC_10545, partial [Bradyrhizobium sp.]